MVKSNYKKSIKKNKKKEKIDLNRLKIKIEAIGIIFLICFLSIPLMVHGNMSVNTESQVESPDIHLSSCNDCFHIVSASGDYLANKLSTDPLFNDLFNFANELGFTKCIGKWLVYNKNNGILLGFIGLRTNKNYNSAIAILSFESGPIKSFLMNFTLDSTEDSIIMTLFNRESGVKIRDNSILDSWGSLTTFGNGKGIFNSRKYITYCEHMAKFLNFRFLEIKNVFSNWNVINEISLDEEEFLENLRDTDLYTYMIELGFDNFILANKTFFQNGYEMIVGAYININNQSIVLIENEIESYLINFTLIPPNNIMMTMFDRNKGVTFNLSNFEIVEMWGYQYSSCSYDRCLMGCYAEWLSSPLGIICNLICGVTCAACIGSMISPEPFSKPICAVCIVCLAGCLGVPFVVCAIACGIDPCSHGHVCYPDTVRNKHCADYYAGHYCTLVWEECNDIGMVWVTHYDYCCSRGRICSTSSLTCVYSGGGGCPILSVYDGEQYTEEGLLDIHVEEGGDDIIREYQLIINPEPVKGAYLLRLTEHHMTHSYIDQVQFMAKLENGKEIFLPLVSAIHSEDGNVKRELLISDEIKTDMIGADLTECGSEYIDLAFAALYGLKIVEFTVIIEGHNYLVK